MAKFAFVLALVWFVAAAAAALLGGPFYAQVGLGMGWAALGVLQEILDQLRGR
ncbi:hypothetical protein [Novosphingopyxis sp. YJ-S2-01]|uniref:hypothetical protein n=1 Tax=Novosphingopyxis sp. YJ-S2-01 TaxID=2794021 RepID=UPI0018DC119F|nr:hypothetical protein [Novosphingopyxis sp. YJ-S2-01]MBH9537502.1 hypothetical protein [Novosphingopyxis sp. YJ-S2-01]